MNNEKQYVEFKVAAVSSNTNSFGLYQMVLVSREGAAFTACKSDPPSKGTVLTLPLESGMITSSIGFHFEIPRKLENAPPAIMEELWAPVKKQKSKHMKKAFTLFELLIVITILVIIALIFVIPATKMLGFSGIEYSDGSRTGVNYKISKKGLIWKTHEGALSLQMMTRDAEGAMVNQVFGYSVSDPSVARDIETFSASGRPITLHYKEYLFRGYKYGSTGYDIVKVTGGEQPTAEQR